MDRFPPIHFLWLNALGKVGLLGEDSEKLLCILSRWRQWHPQTPINLWILRSKANETRKETADLIKLQIKVRNIDYELVPIYKTFLLEGVSQPQLCLAFQREATFLSDDCRFKVACAMQALNPVFGNIDWNRLEPYQIRNSILKKAWCKTLGKPEVNLQDLNTLVCASSLTTQIADRVRRLRDFIRAAETVGAGNKNGTQMRGIQNPDFFEEDVQCGANSSWHPKFDPNVTEEQMGIRFVKKIQEDRPLEVWKVVGVEYLLENLLMIEGMATLLKSTASLHTSTYIPSFLVWRIIATDHLLTSNRYQNGDVLLPLCQENPRGDWYWVRNCNTDKISLLPLDSTYGLVKSGHSISAVRCSINACSLLFGVFCFAFVFGVYTCSVTSFFVVRFCVRVRSQDLFDFTRC